MKKTKYNTSNNVILYCRVSSDEQKEGCSLDMQEKFLRAYCVNQRYNILSVHHEDHSAKSYMLDRPVLKDIYTYCRRNSSNVDKVLFLRWDRFSRNLEFALTYKRKFVDELGVEINAIESAIDFNGAEWSTLLGLYCGVAHTEDIKISKRTKDGIHGTLLKGKWCCRAPRGYKNVRHGKHDTEVVLDSIVAPIIQQAFREVAEGVECVNNIRKRLLPNIPQSTFAEMIRNPFYMGVIHVPAYNDDEEQDVRGQHEPLVSRQLFEEVQSVVNGNRNKQPKVRSKIPHPDFYLRGVMTCGVCGYAITASHSKSGNGNLYGYYHCSHNQSHFRMRAEKANEEFVRFVCGLMPDKEKLKLFQKTMLKFRQDDNVATQKDIEKLDKEINDYERKIARVQDMLVDGEITKAEKEKMCARYQREIDTKAERSNFLKLAIQTDIKEKIDYAITLIANIEKHLKDAPTDVKMRLIRSMFPEKLTYDGNSHRTGKVNSMLDVIVQQTRELRIGKRKKATESFDSIAFVPHIRVELMIFCVRGRCPGPLDECGLKTGAKVRTFFKLTKLFFGSSLNL